ncbi:uncharacterized protein DEA37_0014365 [Paragonimus westermani]|uniref:Homeobox domain-containing protein n=1 Tax=Paragonimus westermani TaxID=34504 RepID=A0A5J4NYD0_9TREM|nr:uncharacterized protein DEA37_0014365 [Paragonimus westermani]
MPWSDSRLQHTVRIKGRMPEREVDSSPFLATTPITCAIDTSLSPTVSTRTKPMNKGFSIQQLLCANESGIEDSNEDKSTMNLNMQRLSVNRFVETTHHLRDSYTNEGEDLARESNRNERASKMHHLTANSHDRLAILFNLLQHNYSSLRTSHSSVSNMFSPLYESVNLTEVPDLVNLGIHKSDIASKMMMNSVSSVDGTGTVDFGPNDTKLPVKQLDATSNEDTQYHSAQMAMIMPATINHNDNKPMDNFFPFMLQNTVSGYASIPVYSRDTSGSKQCRRRKARTVFSDNQLLGLEHRFGTQHYLSTPERIELANQLSLSETQETERLQIYVDVLVDTAILYVKRCSPSDQHSTNKLFAVFTWKSGGVPKEVRPDLRSKAFTRLATKEHLDTMLEYGQGQHWVDGGQHEQPDEPSRNGIGQTDEEWQAKNPPIEGTGHARKPVESCSHVIFRALLLSPRRERRRVLGATISYVDRPSDSSPNFNIRVKLLMSRVDKSSGLHEIPPLTLKERADELVSTGEKRPRFRCPSPVEVADLHCAVTGQFPFLLALP